MVVSELLDARDCRPRSASAQGCTILDVLSGIIKIFDSRQRMIFDSRQQIKQHIKIQTGWTLPILAINVRVNLVGGFNAGASGCHAKDKTT
jgi:hypothetical protein